MNLTLSANVKMHFGVSSALANRAAGLSNATAVMKMLEGQEGGCMPVCTWKCTTPSCNQECVPVCDAPQCQTRCKADYKGCAFSCNQPSCGVICPDACSASECPTCQATCGSPKCTMQCPQTQPCKSVCETPACRWKCGNPQNCPAPDCSLTCETPKRCPDASVFKELPPLACDETLVGSYSGSEQIANAYLHQPVISLSAVKNSSSPCSSSMEHVNTTNGLMTIG